ncbi:tetratricopeptide repeat protein [Saccharothrix stipae]
MPDPVRIEMSGEAAAVVQAGSIVGGVHVHPRHVAPSPARPITGWHPFDLDVHRAVTVNGAGLPDLPAYLPREHDRALAETLAAKRTAMVVLTGESSTGKTRALYEAVTAELGMWPLLYPRTAEDLLHVLATGVDPGTVLWLNETQNHLLDTHGERAAAALRTLLELPGPFVVVGTLWPQYWSTLTGPNQPQARDLLHHRVTRIRVARRFTAAQMAAAPTDPRLAKALATAHNGEVVQAIAGGPAVVERYDHPDIPEDRYATAILTAALDARRLGHHALLTTALLTAAAPGYLSDDDRMNAPETWFEIGLRTAAATRLGVAALIPKRLDPGVGPPDGYHLHDYLDQHGRSTRRRALTPDSLWDAILSHTQDTEDRFRLARNAYHRLRYRHADPLYREAAVTGSATTALRMMDVLIAHGRVEDVRELLDRKPIHIHAHETAEVLRQPWLPHRRTFLEMMERRGSWASLLLADELVRLGSTDDAIAVLRRTSKVRRLADVLADAGRWDEALEIVRAEPAGWAGAWLAERFAATGNVDQLRRLAATGVPEAVVNLAAHTLATDDRADAEALVSGLVEAGHPPTERLLAALVDRGEHELAIKLGTGAAAADALLRSKGERAGAIQLLRRDVFTKSDEWRADRGQELLADLLADKGRWPEALELAKGQLWAQEWIPKRLALAGNLDALRELADTGLSHAGRELAALLAERGRHGELLDRTRKGDEHCAQRLAALAHHGKVPNSEWLLAEGL